MERSKIVSAAFNCLMFLLACVLMAVILIAVACGDGDNGLLELLNWSV